MFKAITRHVNGSDPTGNRSEDNNKADKVAADISEVAKISGQKCWLYSKEDDKLQEANVLLKGNEDSERRHHE